MNRRFKIFFSDICPVEERPPISFKVSEYFENFIAQHVLRGKKVLLNSKWSVEIVLAFCEESTIYKSDHLFMAKSPVTVTSEGVKIFDILIPLKLIKSSPEKYLKTIELIYEALSLFFTTQYKKISIEFFSELWSKVDIAYLLSLPYPAPLTEQKYLADITINGEVKNIIAWSELKKA